MSPEGWSKINFNWVKSGASMYFYGCNTGNDFDENGKYSFSFARKVSKQDNFKNVTVIGQPSGSFPSTSPLYRKSTLTRSKGFSLSKAIGYSIGDTYMVAGNAGEGKHALWFSPLEYKPVKPLNSYKNGVKTGTINQK